MPGFPLGLSRFTSQRVRSGVGSATTDANGRPSATGLKPGSSASLFNITAGGPAVETVTVDAQGKATFTTSKQGGQAYVIDAVYRLDAGVGQVGVPYAPILSLAAANGQITLNWVDSGNGGSTITSHNLYRGTVSGSLQFIGNITTASPYVDVGLTNGTTYIYQITAKNSVGEGARSAEISATPTAAVQLQKWKDALAALSAGTRSITLLGLGPNHLAGYTSTMAGAHQTSPLAKVADAYAAQGYKVNTCAFFGNQSTSATNPYTASSSTSFDSRITMSGVTLAGASGRSIGQFPFVFNKSGDTLNITKEDAVDSFDGLVCKSVPAAGVVNVVANGSVVGTLSANSATNGVQKQTVTFPKGVQTVSLVWVSGYFSLAGGIVYDSTAKEIRIFNVGIDNAIVDDITYASSVQAQMSNLAVLAPDLTIIQSNQGDVTALTEMQKFRGGYARMFTWMKDLGSDVIGLTTQAWDTSLTNMSTANQQKYVDWFKGTAANLAIPVIDLFGYLGTYAAENTAGRQANTRQRNAAGYAYDATYIKAGIDAAVSASPLSYPAPQTIDAATVADIQAAFPPPGSTVRLQQGATYACGAGLNLGYTGTADLPVTLTTTGAGTSPAVMTGTLSPDTGNPNFVDIITVSGSYLTVDGKLLNNGNLALLMKDTGRSAFYKADGTIGLNVLRTEMTNMGGPVTLRGKTGKFVQNYIHDLIMVRNDYAATSPKNDNDYGANPFTIAGSNYEIAWNRISRDIAESFDYGTDGGAVELFPIYGIITNIDVHDNYIEGGDGVVEGGGATGQGFGVDGFKFQNNVCLNNFGIAAIHNGGGSFSMSCANFLIANNTCVEENNVLSTRDYFLLDNGGASSLAGFLNPNNGFNENIVVLNNGKSVYKQNDTNGAYHKNNVYLLLNKDPANSGSGNDGTKTHLYNNYDMTLGVGEQYLTANPFVNQAGRDFTIASGSPAVGKGRLASLARPVLGVSSWPADYTSTPPKTATTTTLTTSNSAPTAGTAITLTATLNPTTATGFVVFYDVSTELGRANLVNGVASISTSALAAGTHSNVRAAYYGDAANKISLSNALTITVS